MYYQKELFQKTPIVFYFKKQFTFCSRIYTRLYVVHNLTKINVLYEFGYKDLHHTRPAKISILSQPKIALVPVKIPDCVQI